MKAGEPIRLTFGDSLTYSYIREARHVLRSGGVCLIPSDTSYSLATLPNRRDAILHLSQLRSREVSEEPIILAFGSLSLVERFARLSPGDQRLIDAHFPGPLTLVCEIVRSAGNQSIAHLLHLPLGTVAVRIPDSPVERQLSIEVDGPITTCAIRTDDNQPLRAFDDALGLVRSRMRETDSRFPLFAVKLNRLPYRDLSTVATVQPGVTPPGAVLEPYSVFVFRPGALEPVQLEKSLRQLSWSDFEDWT